MLDRRVRRRVRDGLGASYDAGAQLELRRGPGMIAVRAELDGDRAGDGLAAMREAVASLRRGEGFDADSARARRRVLRNAFAVDGASVSATHGMLVYGSLGADGSVAEGRSRQLSTLRAEDVREVLAAELGEDREVLVLRGRREAIERAAARAKVGKLGIVDE